MNGGTHEANAVSTIWSEVLERHALDPAQSFFAQGGDSLAGMRVVARLYDVLGLDVPVRELFEHPTLPAFTARVTALLAGQQADGDGSIQAGDPDGDRPLSYAQEGLFFLDRAGLAGQAYNVPLTLRLRGALDMAALDRAFSALLRRHESLRTHFDLVNGQASQALEAPRPFQAEIVDLSAWPLAEAQARARREVQAGALAPFDLLRGPLFRARLVRIAADHHLLLIVTHHIVSDGWSLLKVLTQDLGELYREALDGRAPEAAPGLQYSDFARWQREWLQGPVLDEQRAYWREQLAGAPSLLPLPTDRPRPSVASTRGAGVSFIVPTAVTQGLRALAHAEGATLFMVVLAAYQVLLSRWSGETDIVVGSPAAGRSRREFEPLIGYFVASLALRADLSGDPSFRRLLSQVKDTALAAYAHQHLPFEKLVAELQPVRDLSRQPIVQVSLSFQNFPHEVLSLPGLEVTWVDDEPVTSKFDVSMYVREMEDGLRGTIEYASDLFDAETIERMAAAFLEVLASAVEHPEARISRLRCLSPAARAEQVASWQAAATRPVGLPCIHEVIAQQAARTPGAVAVIDADGETSFADLDRRANQLAQYLHSLGIGPDVVVGLCMRRTSRMVVGLLGILKAGGVYMPLDEQWPAERMAHLIEEAAVPVIVTETAVQDSLPSYWGHIVCVDDEAARDLLEEQPPVAPAATATPDHLAYIIYTSGSTGDPKGVSIPHRGLANLLDAHAQAFGVSPGDRILQFTRLSFDVSLLEILLALRSGATLCMRSVVPAASIGPELVRLLTEWHITIAMLPPALLATIPDQPLPTLRVLFTGGEALEPALAARWARGRRFINEYGITETTVCATLDVHEGGADGTSIGRPIANVRTYVLDDGLEPVPRGAVGQLFIGGEGLARGYLRRPGLTAQAFIADPYGLPGSRMYGTGDRVRWRNDGRLDFIGRIDQQVKVRGYRVELGEIEAALLKWPAVDRAVVVSRQDAGFGTRIVAYVIGGRGAMLDDQDLRTHLRSRLPEYMVPAAIVILDAFPLTSSRKVDRKQLPAPPAPTPGPAYVAPRTAPEQALAAIWQDVLQVERVGVDQSFFDLGGDSILALRMQAEAQTRGLHFSLVDVFELPTVGRLAALASHRRLDPDETTVRFGLLSAPDRVTAEQTGYVDAYPLSKLQLGMLFHSAWERGSGTYHAATSHRLNRPLDLPKLQAAVQALVDRHPVLRSTFHLNGYDEPIQGVRETVDVRVGMDDWSHLGREEQDTRLFVFVEGEKRRGFDLASGPLVRFFAHRLTRSDFQLTMSSHHAILDGWSDAAVLTELYADYLARLDGTPLAAKPPLPLTFRDYIAAERRALQNPEHEAYWTNAVEELPRFNLWLRPPAAASETSGDREASDSVSRRFESTVLQDVAAFAARAGVPSKSVFVAAHLHALRAFTGADAVVTGLTLNARLERPHGDEVPGLYLNSVPVQFRARHLPPEASWLDLARHALTLEESILRHRAYPVVEIFRRHAGRDTLDVLFDFINFHVYGALADRLRVEEWKPLPQTNFPLVVTVRTDLHVGHGELAATFHVGRIDRARMETFLDQYMHALHLMTTQPDAVYARSPLVSDADRAILARFNATERVFPAAATVHDLVADSAARHPEAIAAVEAGGSLTYRALDERANQLAHHLRARGVGPDVIVGLCVERSLAMIVGLFGILKAGGAYLPLDPSHPPDRLARMLDEAHVPVVLTNGGLADRLPSYWAQVVDLDLDRLAIAAQPTAPPPGTAQPANLAYVIYTSGSTGQPKAALVPHAGLINLVQAQAPDFALQPGDHVLQLTSLTFDFSCWEILTTLAAGATLHLAAPGRVLTGDELVRTLRERRVTLLMVPPSILHSMGDAPSIDLPDLRQVIVAGEACPPSLARSWAARGRLLNGYGPTETSAIATYGELSATADVVHLGRAVANTRLYVLTPDLRQTPVGVVGELFIAGVGVGRGYLNRPGLTAERFMANPFSTRGERMYRTGDLVRYQADGTVEFMGRADQQVKLRGIRVELGEIEAALLDHPDVTQAVVVPRGDDMHRTLTAYVVGAPHGGPDDAALRAHLRRTLPDFMVPARFLSLAALPLTANGKIDRAALPVADTSSDAEAYVAPRTDVEVRLAATWAALLKVDRVGIHDDFFVLGGHSLLATRLIAWIQEALQIELPIKALFDTPTIAGLAECIDNERWLLEQALRSDAVG